MMVEEFKEKLDRLNEALVPDLQVPYPSAEEYKIIEKVYGWYPDQNWADQETYVKLYFNFGMIIFYDMERRATRMMELSEEIRMKKSAIENLKVGRMA